MQLPKLYIKPEREKTVYNRHSWIFSGSVARKTKMSEGDIIEVRYSDDRLAGYAFFVDGKSIVAKVFEHTAEPVDVLSPDYWKNKVFKAYSLRKTLVKHTTAYRLFYAEGDFLPGLIIDVYNDIAVIQLYNKGMDKIFPFIVEAVKELGFNYVYLKKKAHNSQLELGWITEPYNGQVIIDEYGIKFLIDITQGQKTGFYVDQRENRKLIEKYANERMVLNLFSYTGGFSLYALRAGAKLVHSVDISERAINLAKQNVELNSLPAHRHQGFVQDCFDFLKQAPENFYDLIVIDPPAFAKSQQTVKNAARGYKDINLRAMRKIKPGGIIFTFSCSQRIEPQLFRKIIFAAAADAGRNIRILQQLSQGIDHPVNIFHPETEYLKGLVLYIE